MTDTNTQKRKKMIKEMKKKVPSPSLSEDNTTWFYCSKDDVLDFDSKGTIKRVRGFKKDDSEMKKKVTMCSGSGGGSVGDSRENSECGGMGKLYGVPVYVIEKIEPKKEPKELNFLEAFLILIGTIALFIFVQAMLEIRQDSKLITCELRGDCSEVIRDINTNK